MSKKLKNSPIAPVISTGVTHRVRTLTEFTALTKKERGNETYGRYLNASLTSAEKAVETLLDAERALLFGSGMAAISSTITSLLTPDTMFIYSNECYRKTDQFFQYIRNNMNIPVIGFSMDTFMNDYKTLIRTTKAKNIIVFIETPSNPLLKLIDITELAKLVHSTHSNTSLIVDTTMATPFLVHPRNLGADIEIHSATKYLGGHDNLFAGIVAGSAERLQPISEMRSILGGISSPYDLGVLEQQIQTFPLRMREISERGLVIAEFLSQHPAIQTVYYPGLFQSPYYLLAKKWLASTNRNKKIENSIPFGSVVSFSLKETYNFENFANAFGFLGVNFGGTHMILDPFGYRQTPEMLKQLHIRKNTFRLSVGLEFSPDEIMQRLQAALDK